MKVKIAYLKYKAALLSLEAACLQVQEAKASARAWAAEAFIESNGFGVGSIIEDRGRQQFKVTGMDMDQSYLHDDPGTNYIKGVTKKKDGTWGKQEHTIYHPKQCKCIQK